MKTGLKMDSCCRDAITYAAVAPQGMLCEQLKPNAAATLVQQNRAASFKGLVQLTIKK
jgi:hypothetical protein